MNYSAELETPFSQLSMDLNMNRSAFRICPPLNLVFKIGHLLSGQILKSSLPFITMEAGQVVSKSFVSTVPPPQGWAAIMTFHFSEP